MVKLRTTAAKALKVFNQDATGGTTIQAHIMRTDGSQEVVKYDFLDLAQFLYRLDVPHSIDEAGISRFLKCVFSDTATRVFLNWTEDGEPDNVLGYWDTELVMVMEERSAKIQADITALTDTSLPPGVEKGSFAEQQYHNCMEQQYGAHQQMEG